MLTQTEIALIKSFFLDELTYEDLCTLAMRDFGDHHLKYVYQNFMTYSEKFGTYSDH